MGLQRKSIWCYEMKTRHFPRSLSVTVFVAAAGLGIVAFQFSVNVRLRREIESGGTATAGRGVMRMAPDSHRSVTKGKPSGANAKLSTFRAAVRRMLRDSDSLRRRFEAINLISQLSPDDLPAAAEFLIASPAMRLSGLLDDLFARWAEFDPDAAWERASRPDSWRSVLFEQGLRMKTAEHCRNYCRHPLLGSGADRIISFPRKAGRFTVKLQQIVHYNSRA